MSNDTTELSLASLELDKLEAVVELMFFAAYADGTIDPSERAVFEKNAVTATHGQLRPEVIRAVLNHFEITAKKEDRTVRLEAIAKKLPDAKVRRAVLVLPKRWIVERTIAWLNRCRRLSKDLECLNRNALAFLRWASVRLMLRRLCQSST